MSNTFSDALKVLKDGGKVCRSGWNGKGMSVQLHFVVGMPPMLVLKKDGEILSTWVPSMSDVLSEDWAQVHDGRVNNNSL